MDDKWKSFATVVGLMVGSFGLLEIILPASLVAPLGALVAGLILTSYLVSIGKWTWSTALPTWLAAGMGLIFVYLIVSRPATVVGSFIDGNGVALVGKTLVLTDSSGVDHKTVTDENGAFEINNVPDGKFTISADGELLISGRVRSGWLRILDPKVETGDVVYRAAQTVNIIATPPATIDTPTLPPTPTSTPTATPPPVACNFPPLTNDLFPQLANEQEQFPLYGPVDGADAQHIFCEAVSDPTHRGSIAVHFRYEKVDKNSGWFGIATPNGYDASVHKQLCFWAYAKQPRQTFRVKMKDTSRKEDGPIVTIGVVNEWEQICTDISKFRELGINVAQMDNVNLGFEDPLGSAEIWIADFEFVD